MPIQFFSFGLVAAFPFDSVRFHSIPFAKLLHNKALHIDLFEIHSKVPRVIYFFDSIESVPPVKRDVPTLAARLTMKLFVISSIIISSRTALPFPAIQIIHTSNWPARRDSSSRILTGLPSARHRIGAWKLSDRGDSRRWNAKHARYHHLTLNRSYSSLYLFPSSA